MVSKRVKERRGNKESCNLLLEGKKQNREKVPTKRTSRKKGRRRASKRRKRKSEDQHVHQLQAVSLLKEGSYEDAVEEGPARGKKEVWVSAMTKTNLCQS